ncbi:MAG: UbiA prenyltransferase family protein [Candidatus Odinarchaeota archaeon]
MKTKDHQSRDKLLIGMLRLIRPYQYYKNVLIVFGIVFAGELIHWGEHLVPLLAGFVGLCCVSSLNYVLNDLKDIESDKLHPEKRNRPLPSGTVPVKVAFLMIAFLMISSLIIGFFVGLPFLGVCFLVFLTSQLYSFYFKQIIFADVSFIAINYVWRAVAGVVIINQRISPWLILLGFLFALFLALSKRKGDLLLLGEDAVNHKKVFQHYNMHLIDQATSIVSATMIVSYSLYIFESETFNVANIQVQIFTVPLVTFCIFRYLYLLEKGGKLARRPELIFVDHQIVICGFLAGVITVLSIYVDSLGIVWQDILGLIGLG